MTSYCDYPAAARQKNVVGDFSTPSLERIIALQPTLVIVSLPEQRRIEAALEQLSIPVFALSPRSLADLYEGITTLGRLIGRQGPADSLVQLMKSVIVGAPTRERSVYIELNGQPLMTVGSGSLLGEVLDSAGGCNVFAELTREFPIVSQEEVIRRDPEVIIVLHPGSVVDRTGWSRVRAVREGRVFAALDDDLLLRPGPRLALGYAELRKVLE